MRLRPAARFLDGATPIRGLTWDAQGEMPARPRRTVNAVQSVEFFRVG